MTAYVIVGINVLLLALLVACGLLLTQWRKKRRREAELETLLNEMSELQPLRSNKLKRHLTAKWRLDDGAAQTTITAMLEAEKGFLQWFLLQQLQQESLAGFHEKLYELLDSHLASLPGVPNQQKQVPGEPMEDVQPEHASAKPASEAGMAAQEDEEQAEDDEPDWGDVFD